MAKSDVNGLEIAIIGYSGKFNNCINTEDYWSKLLNEQETFHIYSKEELHESGIAENIYNSPDYVRVKGVLEDKECFDPQFFGYTPAEANIMDPQIRIFHEIVWNGLEMAGCNPEKTNKRIGLYGSASDNNLWQSIMSLNGNPESGMLETSYLSNKDHLCSLISYKLNLKGPAIFTQTACSSSLVAVHQAVRALLTGDCEIAVAGGVSASLLDKGGYQYHENLIYSPDGHCRAFDSGANGTLKGEGGGVVVLKKYKDALKDGDTIHAVIKGTAVNNDGSDKIGFTAPGIQGQKRVIKSAVQLAGIDPDSVSYIETHGTATKLGDPIEFKALNEGYGQTGDNRTAIGSVKTNIGHLDGAAGIASLIKVILMMKYRKIPASLNFRSPNPEIDFENSSFYVNNQLRDWESLYGQLRAGISSFGIGGTNCHIIVEEPVHTPEVGGEEQVSYTINLSAKTPKKLQETCLQLANHLRDHPAVKLQDLSYTLNCGRADFSHRVSVTTSDTEELVRKLSSLTTSNVKDKNPGRSHCVFLFSGQGAQYVEMGKDLYEKYPFFRQQMDECFGLIERHHGILLKEEIYRNDNSSGIKINDTLYTQLSLFTVSYAMAKFLIAMGIKPDALIGHSIGEYAGAVISDMISLDEAIQIIGKRASLMQNAARGEMYAVFVNEKELKDILYPDLSIAAVNDEGVAVISGNKVSMSSFIASLNSKNIITKKLNTSHAFHSAMMDEILEEYRGFLENYSFKKGKIPLISNVSGQFLDDGRDAAYWSRHLRDTVRFGDGLKTLIASGYTHFIEVGPGNQLAKLAERLGATGSVLAVNTLRPENQAVRDDSLLGQNIGKLWMNGWPVEWTKFYEGQTVKKIPLPVYQFERMRFPLQVDLQKLISNLNSSYSKPAESSKSWLYESTWAKDMSAVLAPGLKPGKKELIVFCDNNGIAESVLEESGVEINALIKIRTGKEYKKISALSYEMNYHHLNEYGLLISDLKSDGYENADIIHAFGLNDFPVSLDDAMLQGYLSLVFLVKSLSDHQLENERNIMVLATEMAKINVGDLISPVKAMLLGALKIISVEHDNLNCKLIDPGKHEIPAGSLIIDELLTKDDRIIVAYRKHSRFIPSIGAIKVDETCQEPLKDQGCYLITGGLGGMGLAIAHDLALKEKAKLALISRRDFPAEGERKVWVDNYGKEDAISQIIYQIWDMEKNGAEILIIKADVAEELQLRNAVRLTEEKFGKINGLIWSAGVIDYDGVIRRRNQEQFIDNIRLKVHGLLIAEQLMKFDELDFIVLFSSAGNLYYKEKFGQVAYNVANEFTDAFAKSNAAKYRISVINWCDWKNAGMTVDGLKKRDVSITADEINTFLKDGLTNEEGLRVFRHCLANSESSYIISKLNLTDFYAEKNEQQAEEARVVEFIENSFERPGLITPFEAPSTETEIFLSDLCCNLFGLNKVGINDDFLELGGDSLKAVHYINQIKKALNVKISLGDFFSNPTILLLSEIINLKLDTKGTPRAEKQIDLSGAYPLLPAQNRIFILDRLHPLQTVHNQIFTFKTRPLNKEKLNDAISSLLERHDVLRASFDLLEGSPGQFFRSQIEAEAENYRILHEDGLAVVMKQFERPFDLSVPPLFRIGYVTNTAGDDFLLVDIHHIISDGMSNKVFLNDLFGYLNDINPAQKSSDFRWYISKFYTAEMQQEIKAEEEYWLNKFKNYSKLNGLTLDHPRKTDDQKNGKRHKFTIPTGLSMRVTEAAKNGGVTVFTYTLSVLYVLLRKLTGESEVVIGATHFGRDISGLENTMGMFIETIPLRNAVDDEMTFQVFLNQIKNNTYEDFDHRKFPFEELISKLELPKDRKRNPLFDIVFSSDNLGENTAEQQPDDQVILEYIEHGNIKVGFDLLFTFSLHQNELIFCFEYNSGLFEEQTILLYSAYYQYILNQIVEKPDLRLKEISLLLSEDQEIHPDLVLRGKEATQTAGSHVFSEFYKIAEEAKANTAIDEDGREITYGELVREIGKLSDYLSDSCVIKEGDSIAIYLPRSAYLIIAILAITKSRAVFVPIDISLPEERVKYIMENSDAKVVLTLADYMFDLTYFEGTVFCMDIQSGELPISEEHIFRGELTDAAYILFTSGSTGYPKGVKISHRGLANYISWANEFYFDDQQKYDLPLFTSISFDFTLTSIFSPLLRGAAVHIFGDDKAVDICLKSIFQSGIKAIKATPAHIDMLSSLDLKNTSLEIVILGGEELLPKQVTFLKKLNKDIRIFNEYGPTEATVACTAILIEDEHELITVGYPVNNTQIYILDEQYNLLPSNVPGEIFIAGECLAEGYLNEEHTRRSFIELPADSRVKIYKSGDKGLLNSAGSLVYMGRMVKNDQVKIRGYRIELKEIEKIFSEIENVDRAVALVKKLNHEDTLVAYYLANEQLDERKIKAVLTRYLPKPMVPGLIIWMKEFPVNMNGKVDYNLFPDPVITKSTSYIPPVYEIEMKLVEIWSDVLNIGKENIGLNDGFFAMGGNSLKVVLLSQKIEDAFDISVQVAELFDHDTINTFISKFLKDFNKNNAAVNTLDNTGS